MTFSLKKNRRNTRSYSGSSTPAPSRSTASRPNTRNRTKPVREKRQFSLWSKLQGGRVQRFFCVLLLRAGLVAAVTGLCAGSIWLYGKATTSDFFATRHIDVAGNVRLSREMVLQYGGLKEGENSLAVSIAEVERKLRATPWVEEVSVGGESGPDARICDYAWVLSLRDQCLAAGVRFSFHQTGSRFLKDGKLYSIPRRHQHLQARKAGIDLP